MNNMDSHKPSHIMLKHSSFTTKEAIQILQAVDKYKTIELPPCKPKGGEVYLFDLPKERKGYLMYDVLVIILYMT